MDSIGIRPAASDDARAVQAIYAHYVTTSVATFEENVPAVDEMARRIDDARVSGLPFLVACRAATGEVIGFGYCTGYRARSAYRFTVEDSVYVHPDARGQGAGRLLLSELLDACSQAGIRQVVAVIADTGDSASVELHRRLGFTDAGRLTAVGYKHGRWIDTIRLQRALDIDDPGPVI
jgi:L-amino acid N-acyltransferase YncA